MRETQLLYKCELFRKSNRSLKNCLPPQIMLISGWSDPCVLPTIIFKEIKCKIPIQEIFEKDIPQNKLQLFQITTFQRK